MNVVGVVRKTGATADTVRYYARIGLLQPRRDPRNRYKTFTEADVTRLRFILRARQLGFSLRDIGEILQRSDLGGTPCPLVREIIRRRLDEQARELDAILILRERMRMALAKWQEMPDRLPDGKEISALIASVDT
ncbi:MAG TPA: MerR family transcriptional regulator [Burkholderiales bacterium]|nr:MerR family transcriptional regulator [Burkholderiales bacterium]